VVPAATPCLPAVCAINATKIIRLIAKSLCRQWKNPASLAIPASVQIAQVQKMTLSTA